MSSTKPKLIAGLAAVCLGAGGLTLAVGQGPGPGGPPQPPSGGSGPARPAGGSPPTVMPTPPPGGPVSPDGGAGSVSGPPGGPAKYTPVFPMARLLPPFGVVFKEENRFASPKQTARSSENLKRLHAAMDLYLQQRNHFPTGMRDEVGRLTLSWRVELLPYISPAGGDLFARFDPDEPWDGPTNKPLLALMPDVYKTGQEADAHTLYQMFMGAGALLDLADRTPFPGNVTDGTANTLAIAELGPAVPWTKPADIAFTQRRPMAVVAPFHNLWHGITADGTVRLLRNGPKPATLKAAITRAGGEAFDWGELLLEQPLPEPRAMPGGGERQMQREFDMMRAEIDRLRREVEELKKQKK